MAWPGAKRPPALDADEKGKSALPPPCPRCELTKGQFTRTIQNFQKAYRKKVEGLKTELKSSRAANGRLTKQVKQLNSLTRVHLPSIAVGVLAGAACTRLLAWLLQRRRASKKVDVAAAARGGDGAEAPAAASEAGRQQEQEEQPQKPGEKQGEKQVEEQRHAEGVALAAQGNGVTATLDPDADE